MPNPGDGKYFFKSGIRHGAAQCHITLLTCRVATTREGWIVGQSVFSLPCAPSAYCIGPVCTLSLVPYSNLMHVTCIGHAAPDVLLSPDSEPHRNQHGSGYCCSWESVSGRDAKDDTTCPTFPLPNLRFVQIVVGCRYLLTWSWRVVTTIVGVISGLMVGAMLQSPDPRTTRRVYSIHSASLCVAQDPGGGMGENGE